MQKHTFIIDNGIEKKRGCKYNVKRYSWTN